MFNEIKKAEELLSPKSEIDEKNNSDTLKNQLNEKMDEKKPLTFKN